MKEALGLTSIITTISILDAHNLFFLTAIYTRNVVFNIM